MDVGLGLSLIAGDFQALSEDEYDDMMLETEEEEMMVANVVKIFDGDSSEKRETADVDDEDGRDDVYKVLYRANGAGMGQSG